MLVERNTNAWEKNTLDGASNTPPSRNYTKFPRWEYLARKNRTLDYYYYYYYFFPTSMDAISRNYLIILNAAFIDH